jgi:hypothetical protein
MNKRIVVLLFCAVGLNSTLPAFSATSATNSYTSVTGPIKSGNMAIYVIHGKDKIQGEVLTLQEALAAKQVIVRETGNVNELTIQNLSGKVVFVQAGEIVKGGQQDRTIQFDMLLQPKSGIMPLPSFCVEHGRWSGRGNESSSLFQSSRHMVAGKSMKAALNGAVAAMPPPMQAQVRGGYLQDAVWGSVDAAQRKLSKKTAGAVASEASPSSMELTLEHKRVQEATARHIAELSKVADSDKDSIGYAVAINGKIVGADMYASHQLFKKLWPKLLNSSAVEAVAERDEKSVQIAEPSAVKAFLDDAKAAPPRPKNVKKDSRMDEKEGRRSYQYSTYWSKAPSSLVIIDERPSLKVQPSIHDNFLAK